MSTAHRKKLSEFLQRPIVDKIVGGIAVSPVIFTLAVFAERTLEGYFNVYGVLMALNQVLIVIFTLIRRAPIRVSINPVYWFITAGRTYWTFVVFYYIAVWPSIAIVPAAVSQALLVLSLAIIIWARFTLGRNIGFIPAQRRIVSTGIYAYVRHPIHIGHTLFLLSYMLQSFSAINCAIIGIGILFVLVKSIIEERFLCESQEYQMYYNRVRYRWIPFIA